jgi:hypothetical protein
VLSSRRLLPAEASERFFFRAFGRLCSNDLLPMTLRNRFVITAALLCHLLLVPPLVTSQLPPVNPSSTTQPALLRKNRRGPSTTLAGRAFAEQSNNRPTICAIQQERDGDIYKLHGAVEIYYEDLRIEVR